MVVMAENQKKAKKGAKRPTEIEVGPLMTMAEAELNVPTSSTEPLSIAETWVPPADPAPRMLASHVFYMENNGTVEVPSRYLVESVSRLSPTAVEVLAWV